MSTVAEEGELLRQRYLTNVEELKQFLLALGDLGRRRARGEVFTPETFDEMSRLDALQSRLLAERQEIFSEIRRLEQQLLLQQQQQQQKH
jgi:hypothetical protein